MHNNTFPIQYAHEQITQEHWNSPIFIRVNQILTLTWGIAFALSALIQLAAAAQRFYDSTHSPSCDRHLDDDTLPCLVSQSGIKK
ncbi:hypothetical protein [uncultured Nostoc sp.]|uniref:hypothetical protein n=1 Tax=uncultured Nostoc sp. TaxID=340711 RepID=UPI0035C9451C